MQKRSLLDVLKGSENASAFQRLPSAFIPMHPIIAISSLYINDFQLLCVNIAVCLNTKKKIGTLTGAKLLNIASKINKLMNFFEIACLCFGKNGVVTDLSV